MNKDDLCHATDSASGETSSAPPLQSDFIREALKDFDAHMADIGGCSDGNCLVLPPKGMHTNGGCRCWQKKYTAQRVMSAGKVLRKKLQSQIEEARSADTVSQHDAADHDTKSKLEEAKEIIRDCQSILASYLPPDSGITPQQCVSDLLDILDGPRARSLENGNG